MVEQLKGCLIVRAVSIFAKSIKVNGFGRGSALWIGKPADWISGKKSISLWIKKAPLWSRQGKPTFYIMKKNQLFYVLFLGENL